MAGFPELPFPPDFEVQDGRRSLPPYETTRTVNVKMRWRGRPLQEVASAVSSENLLLNGRRCAVDELLENGDVLKHSFVMQEPTVSDEPILKLAENEHVLVVQKPAGLPCHPQGKYQRCSLTEVLRAYLKDANAYLHPVNRLDRQTSGVVILAKSRKAYMALVQEHGMGLRKVYVARVHGRLDAEAAQERWPQWVDLAEGWICCKLPLRVQKHQADQPLTTVVDLSGKAAETRFRSLGADLVLCCLETGRTHQIRVHLAALGCPIAGDALYGREPCDEDTMCLHAAAYSIDTQQTCGK
ncbi:unnamed protein product, partial [Effrenium voratum]